MRIHGIVTIGGSRALIDWTITADGIESAGGLSANEITVSGALPTLAGIVEEVTVTDEYDSLTVVDLRVMLTERSSPIYGNKNDLISRLRAWDVDNPDGLTTVVEELDVEDSGESEEATGIINESGDVE